MMAALSVRAAADNMLLHVLFLAGSLSACEFTPPVSIDAPNTLEALSGSCLQIPCTFKIESGEEFDITRTSFGIWIIRDNRFAMFPENVIFNSSKNENTYPMTITGDLSEKNCTTLFSNLTTGYTDIYFFRIENPSFKATAACDPLYITVSDSAPRPRINISGDGAVNDLKEKQSVTITCSAVTPCPHSPPELTWTLQQNPHNIREQNADGTFTTKIQETITLSDTHDGLNISCSARYPVNEGRKKTAAEEITLSVSYAPKDTSVSISPPGLVSAGSWVNLTCSSRGNPPISSFTWFKNSKDGAIKVSEGWFYRINVTDGGDYYCVATNDLGNEISSVIRLTDEDSVRDPSVIISPTDPVSAGSLVNLTCSCRGNPPVVSFVWFMISDGRLVLIPADTAVYGFKVTDSDRGRLYYCGCRKDPDFQLSTGRQLTFERDGQFGAVSVEVVVKTLGIIVLFTTLIAFECWFKYRKSTKPVKDAAEAVYVNTVCNLPPS